MKHKKEKYQAIAEFGNKKKFSSKRSHLIECDSHIKLFLLLYKSTEHELLGGDGGVCLQLVNVPCRAKAKEALEDIKMAFMTF